MKTRFNFDEVIDRAKKSLKINHDCDFAEKLGMKAGAFNARKKAQSLPYEELLILADAEKIDFNWLLTGEGEMLKTKPAPTQTSSTEDRRTATSDRRLGIMQELLDGLNQTQQQEILAAIEEKKQLNQMRNQLDQLMNQQTRQSA